MGVKKYFGERPQKEPKPFSAQFGVNGNFDDELIEDTRPSYFPAPEKLAEYEELSEGAADRIIALVQKEQDQRHRWENDSLSKHHATARLGQFFAFLSVFVVVAAVIFLSAQNQYISASVLALAGIIAIGLNVKSKPEKKQKFVPRPRKKFRRRR